MRVAIKIVLLSFLLAITLPIQHASAAFVELINLPNSTYARAVDNWQGYIIHNQDGYNLRIDFSVYDRQNIDTTYTEDEYWFIYDLTNDYGLTNRYIYAYQLLQTTTGESDDVGYFGILKDEEAINGIDVTSIPDDQPFTRMEEGKAPAFSNNIPISWGWYESDPLAAGEHSWFLVFSSNFAPVVGSFDIRPPEAGPEGDGGQPPADPGIPEPATLAMLGIGGATIFLRRRKLV